MKLLFVADPLSKIKPKSDSTLMLVRAALRRGHKVYWATDRDVQMHLNRIQVLVSRCLDCIEDELPRLDSSQPAWLKQFDGLFIRKDPPFDGGYVKLCWLLELEEANLKMINKPSLLLKYHEKLVPHMALSAGFLKEGDLIPTFSGSFAGVDKYLKAEGVDRVVIKPFFGYAGGGIRLSDSGVFVQEVATFLSEDEEMLLQPFKKEITTKGDRRVFLLDGKMLAHFVRLPKAGGFISNLAQGGQAVSRPLSTRENAVIERLGKFLKSAGIALAGADLIGHYVSEVNITSPTGLRSLLTLESKDYSENILDYLER